MNKKEIHYNYCSGCIKFLTGVCCGILYHISDIAPQPLCLPVKEQLDKIIKSEKESNNESNIHRNRARFD